MLIRRAAAAVTLSWPTTTYTHWSLVHSMMMMMIPKTAAFISERWGQGEDAENNNHFIDRWTRYQRVCALSRLAWKTKRPAGWIMERHIKGTGRQADDCLSLLPDQYIFYDSICQRCDISFIPSYPPKQQRLDWTTSSSSSAVAWWCCGCCCCSRWMSIIHFSSHWLWCYNVQYKFRAWHWVQFVIVYGKIIQGKIE